MPTGHICWFAALVIFSRNCCIFYCALNSKYFIISTLNSNLKNVIKKEGEFKNVRSSIFFKQEHNKFYSKSRRTGTLSAPKIARDLSYRTFKKTTCGKTLCLT